jgi:hypothetical protein
MLVRVHPLVNMSPGVWLASVLSMDEAFGRAAHVAFLEHVPFMRLFAARYSRFFSDE